MNITEIKEVKTLTELDKLKELLDNAFKSYEERYFTTLILFFNDIFKYKITKNINYLIK